MKDEASLRHPRSQIDTIVEIPCHGSARSSCHEIFLLKLAGFEEAFATLSML